MSLLDLCMYYHTSGGGGGGERMFDLIREVSSFQITYFAVVYSIYTLQLPIVTIVGDVKIL